MTRPRVRVPAACLLLGTVWIAQSAASAGLPAEVLFETRGIYGVSVSPTGEWALARGIIRDVHGLLVQRLGSREVKPVLAADEPIHGVHWIGEHTFLITFVSDRGPRYMVGRLRDANGEIELDRQTILAPGYFVHGLPLVDDTLIWEFEDRGRNSVHRVQLEDLLHYERERNLMGSLRVGETLTSISGSAARWVVDREGRPRAALRWEEDAFELLVGETGSDRLRKVHHFEDPEGRDAIWPMSISADGQLIVLAYGDSDTMGIYEFDSDAGRLGAKIFDREEVDITDAVFDPIHGDLIAAVFDDDGQRRYHYLESVSGDPLKSLRGRFPTESLEVVGRSADRRVYVLRVSGPTDPGTFYLRDDSKGSLSLVARSGAELDEGRLADVETLEVASADGTRIEAFLTLPRAPEAAGAPLVVHPHGGPIGVRDTTDYDPMVQYLASWGFAVLQVNYRGSSGYGLGFQESGKRQWAQGIEDDVDAAVEAVIARSDIDADRICIMGGSYGGFSALASIIRHENRYRCAVTINGVTDVPLSFDSSDFADNERALKGFAEVVGDVATDRDRLIEISPVYHVDRIRTPVYVIYGTEDRRVDPDHSHRLLLMLETLGKQHETLEVQGAAHSFSEAQWIVVAPAVRRFLTEHLLPDRPFVADPLRSAEDEYVRLPVLER